MKPPGQIKLENPCGQTVHLLGVGGGGGGVGEYGHQIE